MNAVAAENLRKSYGDLDAVKGISLTIEEGGCFGFLGPNGAGKTTTMKMISCSLPPSSGYLQVLGNDVQHFPRAIKARLGIVPQEDNLDEDVSVLENLLIYARYFGVVAREAKPRALELLDFMQLSDKAPRSVMELSGGMKRRLMIARGLINQPDMLILDEPTTGLDPQARHLVWEKLRSLKRDGVTLVLTTHYMEEASQLCDRLVIMHEGEILVDGQPRELVRAHASRQVLEVFEPDANAQAALSALEPYADRVERLGDRWLFFTADGEALLRRVREVTADPGEVWLRGGSLEDVFLRLTGRSLVE